MRIENEVVNSVDITTYHFGVALSHVSGHAVEEGDERGVELAQVALLNSGVRGQARRLDVEARAVITP
jgi:hypothetical protein